MTKKKHKKKLSIAVHKFSSCDGCQLAFLNNIASILALDDRIEIKHFAEAGALDGCDVDVSFIEGSVSTPDEKERIQKVRECSRYVIALGACATAGGLQALRNFADASEWVKAVYEQPKYISMLDTSTPLSAHIAVDLELWGCPVNSSQVLQTIYHLLEGVEPVIPRSCICIDCKRRGYICVLVTRKKPCMGPVTQTGCGVLCPEMKRGCYGCFGPKEKPNVESMERKLAELGLSADNIKKRFKMINSEAFKEKS